LPCLLTPVRGRDEFENDGQQYTDGFKEEEPDPVVASKAAPAAVESPMFVLEKIGYPAKYCGWLFVW
jgi:hypothetical protein